MTAQTLPDNPNFCFVPAYDVETEVQQIRIVIEGLSPGTFRPRLIALDLDDALSICDKLNRSASDTTARLGPPWPPPPCSAEEDDPEGGARH